MNIRLGFRATVETRRGAPAGPTRPPRASAVAHLSKILTVLTLMSAVAAPCVQIHGGEIPTVQEKSSE